MDNNKLENKVELNSIFGNKFVIQAEQYEHDPNLIKVEFDSTGIVLDRQQMLKIIDLFNRLS